MSDSSSLLKTPLFDWHKAHSAKMGAFAGWDMPIQYPSGIIEEHLHTRKYAGLFDICHMGEFIFEGEGVGKALSGALTINSEVLPVGKCKYGFLLNEKGGICDDLIVYHLEEHKYMVVVNAGCRQSDLAALKQRVGSGFSITDKSDEIAKIDIQGPESVSIMEKLIPGQWRIPYFSLIAKEFEGAPLLASRTGYTGELGFELYVPAEKAVALWELCLSNPDVKPAGLGARDTLRLEVGLPLNGQDIGEDHTPAEAGYATMLTSQADYVGKAGAGAVRNKLVGLSLPGRKSARHNDLVVTTTGQEAGIVTSGSYGPSVGHAIAFAYIDNALASQSEFIIRSGKAEIEAKVVDLPFYKDGTARTKF